MTKGELWFFGILLSLTGIGTAALNISFYDHNIVSSVLFSFLGCTLVGLSFFAALTLGRWIGARTGLSGDLLAIGILLFVFVIAPVIVNLIFVQ